MIKINKVDSDKNYTRQEATKIMGISNDSFSKYFANSNAQILQAGKRVKYSGELLNRKIDQVVGKTTFKTLDELVGDNSVSIQNTGFSLTISQLPVVSCAVIGKDQYEPVAILDKIKNCHTTSMTEETLISFAKTGVFYGWFIRNIFDDSVRKYGYSWHDLTLVNNQVVLLLIPTIVVNLFNNLEDYCAISREQLEDTLMHIDDKLMYLKAIRTSLSAYYSKYNQVVKTQLHLYELTSDSKFNGFNDAVNAQLDDIQSDIGFIDGKLEECSK